MGKKGAANSKCPLAKPPVAARSVVTRAESDIGSSLPNGVTALATSVETSSDGWSRGAIILPLRAPSAHPTATTHQPNRSIALVFVIETPAGCSALYYWKGRRATLFALVHTGWLYRC